MLASLPVSDDQSTQMWKVRTHRRVWSQFKVKAAVSSAISRLTPRRVSGLAPPFPLCLFHLHTLSNGRAAIHSTSVRVPVDLWLLRLWCFQNSVTEGVFRAVNLVLFDFEKRKTTHFVAFLWIRPEDRDKETDERHQWWRGVRSELHQNRLAEWINELLYLFLHWLNLCVFCFCYFTHPLLTNTGLWKCWR